MHAPLRNQPPQSVYALPSLKSLLSGWRRARVRAPASALVCEGV